MGDAVSPERVSQISENVNGNSRDILDEKGKLRLKVLATRNSSKLGIEGEEFAISLGANLDKINALTSSNGPRSCKDFQLLLPKHRWAMSKAFRSWQSTIR
jgi:hypothetical protein